MRYMNMVAWLAWDSEQNNNPTARHGAENTCTVNRSKDDLASCLVEADQYGS